MSFLDIRQLSYKYHDGTDALKQISLHIKSGERVCLAGPNGAGKTTLLHCLAGLLKPEGHLTINGNPINADPSVLGLVFQNPDDQLFCPTVGEDIGFGPRNQKKSDSEIKNLVQENLSAVGLSGFEQRHAHHLSGGEKKRAAIAAVLACQPEILVFDEPLANLDARASRSVTLIIENFTGTLIMASHDLSHAAKVCTRLIIIDHGSVIADKAMKELLADKKLLQAHGLL